MNVSELARILRVTPQELLDTLPEIGFDIGQKAIKIDTKTSEKIIKEWSRLTRQMQLDKEALAAKTKEEAPIVINRKISIPRLISVKDFATAMGLPVSKILPELMKNGIFASINERIDFDTASIIASDLGVDASLT
ncbi:MAG: translation initiation factor IF-2 N-terminal domain-containing protein, partial [Candidatus Falkowbacteria bacterium]|nr:translation initiation factor IF-2 N-terminal domain-containing protein [Candidatus Falkowbacteria bacterium]